MLNKSISFFSWNVRGLGQNARCDDVLSELISARPTIAAIQETKLSALSRPKQKTFLPIRLSSVATVNSTGASGGILTAWDQATISCDAVVERQYTLTTTYRLNADGTAFSFTNVYAPTLRSDKPLFLAELASLADGIDGPWMILGDFNLTRDPEDKNSDNFNVSEAHLFNSTINELGLIEIPLVDRSFTWSNKRDHPTLVRLDRCFVNHVWETAFPNTTLTSRTRFSSDHVPLMVTASSHVPRSSCFRFENAWMQHEAFRELMINTLHAPCRGSAATSFTQRLKHCRRECRAWARRLRPIDKRENDTRILITALDLLEEARPLTKAERKLRDLATAALHDIGAEKLAFWRQRFNLKTAAQWDENSRFFHTAATGRRRKNLIHCLEQDGQEYVNHDAKSTILFDFYTALLGTQQEVEWRFSLAELYPTQAVAGSDLSRPFSLSEITQALFAMDMNASPGPDGFGPSFYKHFWAKLRDDVLRLFNNFYNGTLDLDGLNRAHLILLPKKQGARTADAFRPISLQNCPMKLFTKVMANRLRSLIPAIVDPDQTGFIHGRSIAENFIYAADLLSCCHKRQVPTVILKLDFKKAFDSVEWVAYSTSYKLAALTTDGATGFIAFLQPGKLQWC
ncbi:unnamed protein product [Urochloa humidicola]